MSLEGYKLPSKTTGMYYKRGKQVMNKVLNLEKSVNNNEVTPSAAVKKLSGYDLEINKLNNLYKADSKKGIVNMKVIYRNIEKGILRNINSRSKYINYLKSHDKHNQSNLVKKKVRELGKIYAPHITYPK